MIKPNRVIALLVGLGALCLGASPATGPVAAIDDYRAKLKARGEPAVGADLIQAHVEDDRNAVLLLTQAGAAINEDKSGPRSSNLEWGEAIPYPAEWHRMAKESIEVNVRS